MADCCAARLYSLEPQITAAFHIRPARPADIPALMAMKDRMALDDGAAGLLDATVEDWLQGCFGAPPRFAALVAEADNTVAGMAIFNEQGFAGWAQPPIYLQDLFVMPQFRRRGIARALVEAVAAEATARRSRLIYLNVHGDNAARRLYDGIGFAPAEKCFVYALMGPKIAALAAGAKPRLRPEGDSQRAWGLRQPTGNRRLANILRKTAKRKSEATQRR